MLSQCAILIIMVDLALEFSNLKQTLAAVPHVDIPRQPEFSRLKFRAYIILLLMSLDGIKTRGSKF